MTLDLGCGYFAAGQSHRFKDLFLLESRFHVTTFLMVGLRIRTLLLWRPIVVDFVHWNVAWVNLTALFVF
jgi:hypothetical protein